MQKSSCQDKMLLACYLTFVCAIYLGAFLSGCGSPPVSPAPVSTARYIELNLVSELNRAMKRGDKVKKIPHGDFAWGWQEPGEAWDFQRWHYEIVPVRITEMTNAFHIYKSGE